MPGSVDVQAEHEPLRCGAAVERELDQHASKAIAASGPARIEPADRAAETLAIALATTPLLRAARALLRDGSGGARVQAQTLCRASDARRTRELDEENELEIYWKRSHVPAARHPCVFG